MAHGASDSDTHPATARDDADAMSKLSTAIEHILSLPQDLQTRPGKHSRHTRTSRDKEREKEDAVFQEFGEKIYQVELGWAAQLYRNLATDDDILEYLHQPASGYDMENGWWKSLSSEPKDEDDLRASIIAIVSDIIQHFHPRLRPGTTRSVVDSHNMLLPHDNGKHSSSPSISVKAEGPSFEVPGNVQKFGNLGYTNVAGVIDARLDKKKGSSTEQAAQLSLYCRQIFFQQPNRHFARSLMITEHGVRLAHYDRSGAYVTPMYNIHEEKEVFVRLILGLVSPNEEDLGLDATVQWVIDEATGRKLSGTINVDEYDDEKQTSTTVTYDLNMQEPPIIRPTIRGRGTVGWHATHPTTGEAVLVKDAWRIGKRTSEVEHLRTALGIPGVVEMLAYQDHCAETRTYRPESFDAEGFENRVKLRIVLKKYGTSIWRFKTRLELLRVLRDALIGHRELCRKGILHRDVSMQNILFGPPDAPEGRRGCLIDLDVAVRTENGVSSVPTTPAIGTRLYQSIVVLRSGTSKFPIPQDYMDDLEGFFYVLCHLVYLFSRPGVLVREAPELLSGWTREDNYMASIYKASVLGGDFPFDEIPSFWGDAVQTLVDEFRTVLFAAHNSKYRIANKNRVSEEAKLEALTAFARDVDVHFDKVKAAFDKAITRLEVEGLSPEELKPQCRSSPAIAAPLALAPATPDSGSHSVAHTTDASSQHVPTSEKRPSEDGPEHDAPHKRRRNGTDAAPPSSPDGCSEAKTCEEGHE